MSTLTNEQRDRLDALIAELNTLPTLELILGRSPVTPPPFPSTRRGSNVFSLPKRTQLPLKSSWPISLRCERLTSDEAS
jgi:hypothetical protein